MKTIYKLASIFMLMLIIGTAIVTTIAIAPTTISTPAANTAVNTAIAILNENKPNPNINYNAIPVITTKQLKPQTIIAYSATFAMVDTKAYSFNNFGWPCDGGNGSCWQSITSYSFTIPYNSYVTIESSGMFTNYLGYVGIALGIDQSNPCQWDRQTYRIYSSGPQLITNYASWSTGTGFQTSRTYYLTKGTHTIYLDGLATKGSQSGVDSPTMSTISITATANTVGNLQVK